MGINAVVSENHAADKISIRVAKKQSDAFKDLIDMSAKKQNFEKPKEIANSGSDSKTDAKVDQKIKPEVKKHANEEEEINKNDDVFENEKNSFVEQAFLARNAVDVINIEIEPVKDVVLTAEVENEEIIPQIGAVPVTEIGQEGVVQNAADAVSQEVGKANITKTNKDNATTVIDVAKEEKQTFKLADTMAKEVVSDKKTSEADMNLDNSKVKLQSQGEPQKDVPAQNPINELKAESENIYAKDDNVEINSEAQIITSPDEDVIVIKVADPVTPSTGKELAEKLGNEIVVKLDNGDNEFQAVLNPKGLGEIAVKLTVESGKIVVSMTCSKDTTKALLENNVSSLVRIVEDKMGQETVVNVYNEKDNSQENFDGQGNKGQYQGNSQHNQGKNDEQETDFIQKLRLGILGMEMEEV